MMIEEEPAKTEMEPAARALSEAARRALSEVEERREAARRARDGEGETAKEVGGRDGPEPTRYGDWEKGGIVTDF